MVIFFVAKFIAVVSPSPVSFGHMLRRVGGLQVIREGKPEDNMIVYKTVMLLLFVLLPWFHCLLFLGSFKILY